MVEQSTSEDDDDESKEMRAELRRNISELSENESEHGSISSKDSSKRSLPKLFLQELHLLKCCPIADLSARCFGIDQFKIISNGRTDVECKIKEALIIKSINPTLNQNLFQHGSSFLINVFK